MSQFRARKAPNGGQARLRASFVKGSGDNVPSNKHNGLNPSNRCNNKIPRSVRYDLENALVGLCDLWFEDIKPHLIRNKIKLHVEAAGPAGGDHGAADCDHLDPGAASDVPQPVSAPSVGCCPTRPTASAARCRRPPAPRPPRGPPPPPPEPTTLRRPTCQNDHGRRKKPCHKTHAVKNQPPKEKNWRVPRLCREKTFQNTEAHCMLTAPKAPPNDHFIKFLRSPSRPRVNYCHKCTQTDPVPEHCPKNHSAAKRNSILKTKGMPIDTNPAASKTKLLACYELITTKNLPVRKHRPVDLQNRSPVREQTTQGHLNRRSRPSYPNSTFQNEHRPPAVESFESMEKITSQRVKVSSSKEILTHRTRSPSINICAPHQPVVSQTRPCSPIVKPTSPRMPTLCGKSQATTTFYPPKSNYRKNKTRKEEIPIDQQPLFDNDLINIIAEKNDKRIRILYRSPNRNDSNSNSIMNLYPSSEERVDTLTSIKMKPWR